MWFIAIEHDHGEIAPGASIYKRDTKLELIEIANKKAPRLHELNRLEEGVFEEAWQWVDELPTSIITKLRPFTLAELNFIRRPNRWHVKPTPTVWVPVWQTKMGW